jgi:HlyD family secretion protein
MKRWILVIVVLSAITGGGLWYWKHVKDNNNKAHYRTTTLERGDIIQTVRASGLIAPMRLVDVGTQVNGPINKLYVDFNSEVKAGDLVAQIDPTTYEAKLAQDQANLMAAQANVEQTTAKLVQAEKELTRTKKLAEQKMLSETDLDAAISLRDSLAAQLKVTMASVDQSKAALRLSQANLGYTTIRSPVDGVVITRNVSQGQTVVASLNAMTLFKIATDLHTIQVEASIPEADIGRIREDQRVTFTVDAYDTTFTGKVAQVRMSASTMQNVVTYPVMVTAENPDNKLFPGMTAIIICEVAQRTNTLKVSNATLRFKPVEKITDNTEVKTKRKGPRTETKPKVWILESANSELKPVVVTLGISDGAFTEIMEPCNLTEGQELITGIDASSASEKTVNPFAPQMPGRSARSATR